MLRKIQFGLVDLLSDNGPQTPVIDLGPQLFGLADLSIINYKGENYVPQKPSLRVRLHNWLLSLERDADRS